MHVFLFSCNTMRNSILRMSETKRGFHDCPFDRYHLASYGVGGGGCTKGGTEIMGSGEDRLAHHQK